VIGPGRENRYEWNRHLESAAFGFGGVRKREKECLMRVLGVASELAVLLGSWGGESSKSSSDFRLIQFLENGKDNIPRNRIMTFRFSAPVAPLQDFFERLKVQNVQAGQDANFSRAVGIYTVDADRVTFTPQLPKMEDRADAGFKANGNYVVFLKSGPDSLTAAAGFGMRRRLDEAKRLIHRGRAQRDAAALEQAVRLLQSLAQGDPPNPAPHLYLVHAQGRLGWLRQDPALHRAAARSARAAIERGYRVAPLLYDLLYESLRAGRADDLRAALKIALDGGIHPDLHCAKLVAEAARAIGDEAGLAAGRKFLERWSARMPEEGGRRLAELLAGLK